MTERKQTIAHRVRHFGAAAHTDFQFSKIGMTKRNIRA
jgi:hypothetical protein